MNYVFDIELAKKYGVDAAIMLWHFEYWIFTNRANGKHFHDGRTWTYGSLRAFAEIWPFWSTDHIHRTLKKLIDQNVLVKGNYNRSGYDRTNWYAFADEKSWFKDRETILHKRRMDLIKRKNRLSEDAEPIPNPKNNECKRLKQLESSHSDKGDLGLITTRDRAIVEGRNRFIDALNRVLRPANKKEATTFARITKHLVTLCETGISEPTVFDEAISWMKEAKQDGRRPKALFVAMIKERTGYAASKRLLQSRKIGLQISAC